MIKLFILPVMPFIACVQVVFADGQATSSIVLTVHADNTPELNEDMRVVLTGVVENGVAPSGDQSKGATIVTGQATSFITVTANDAPHGVVIWSSNTSLVDEVEGMNSAVTLSLVREFGTIGDILVSYR